MVINVTNAPAGVVLARKSPARSRIILQNTGIHPALIRIDAAPTVIAFDHVLTAGTALRSGDGGCLILEGNHGEIKAVTENAAGTTVAVLEVY